MSKKDVLHIPPTPEPRREAGTDEGRTSQQPPIMTPDSGPDDTPAVRGNPRIVEPQGRPGRFPGVHVS